ncbi:MAG: type VI secretion system needle protein Hcp [Bacteroidales bacterium]|jgi:hypothetical protein|nr:type VI secretion system needle protein Hcp [Bacteroidales bacterium]
MAFRANLNFEGEDFDVIKCNYTVERDVDSKGRPASNLYGAKINITVESTSKISLFDKMATQFKPNTGTISFKKDDEDATLKELKWENGYIVNLEEGIAIVGDHPMLTTMTVSAQKFTFGDAILEQNWPEMN